jgi:hypothetical protein
MNLPNFFLADLPTEAVLTPQLIAEGCQTLKRNRERYLAGRSTSTLVQILSETADCWLRPDYPFRQRTLELGPAATGFPAATLASGLDAFFRQLTPDNFQALLEQELGHARRLDEPAASPAEQKDRRSSLVTGPELLVHIAAGNLPVPTLLSIVLGILVRSAQFVKCATGTALIPRLFAHSLHEAEPRLGACLEIAEWPGSQTVLNDALLAEADFVTATGSDEALGQIRQRLPSKTRFLGYGHRLSFGYVTHLALAESSPARLVANAATDLIAWNQMGCLSPHVFYVENSRSNYAVTFAQMLAQELDIRETKEPRGPVPVEIAAAIAWRRAFYEVRAAHSPDTRLWCSPESTAWTVVYEAEPQFQTSCLHRFIYVKGVANLTEALQGADAVRGKVSTVGLGATNDQLRNLALQLLRWGVPRICPLGQMQNPPLAWRHDGRPALADLVTWTDWEQ